MVGGIKRPVSVKHLGRDTFLEDFIEASLLFELSALSHSIRLNATRPTHPCIGSVTKFRNAAPQSTEARGPKCQCWAEEITILNRHELIQASEPLTDAMFAVYCSAMV